MSKNTQSQKNPSVKASKKKKPSGYASQTPVKDDELLVGVYAWSDTGEDGNQPPRTRLGIVTDLVEEGNLRRFDALGHLWPIGTASVVFRGSRDLETPIAGFIKLQGESGTQIWEEATTLETLADLVRKSVFSEMRRNAVRSARGVDPKRGPAPSFILKDDQLQGLIALKKTLKESSEAPSQVDEVVPSEAPSESPEQTSV